MTEFAGGQHMKQPPTQAFLGELVFRPSPQTAFVRREEIRAPLKTPAWEATYEVNFGGDNLLHKPPG